MKKRALALILAVVVTGTTALTSFPAAVTHAEEGTAGTTYYVSSKSGDNTNSGVSESQAWETLDKVPWGELEAGDTVLLEKGSVFNGTIQLKDVAGTKDAPIKISSYGDSGNKPVINGNGQGIWYQDYEGTMDNASHKSKGYVSSTILLYDVDFVEISGLEITNQSDDFDYFRDNVQQGGTARMDRTGVAGMAKNGGTMEHIYLDDLYIHDVDGNITDKHMNNGGIQMNVTPPDNENKTGVAKYKDVKITDCYVKDVSRAGIVVGYTYQATKFNGSEISDEKVQKYGHSDILIEGNYVQNAGNDAICVMYADRPVVQRNISDKAGVDLPEYKDKGFSWQTFCAAIWPWKTKNALFQYNEAFDTVQENNGDGQAWDIDWSDGTLYQYNYSHGNGGGALLVCATEAYNGTFRYNISQNDLKAFVTLQANPKAYIYNNVFYLDGDMTTAVHHPESGKRKGEAYFANNIFYNVSTAEHKLINDGQWNKWTPNSDGQTFENNLFVGYNDQKENGVKVELPGTDAIEATDQAGDIFVDPGKAPTEVKENHTVYYDGENGAETYAGYKLKEDSPAINAGTYVEPTGRAAEEDAENGAKDFFGNTVGFIPDIGVHEYDNKNEEVSLEVRSGKYDVDTEKGTIGNIPDGTTVEVFLANLTMSGGVTAEVKRENSELNDNDELKTGDVLTVTKTGKSRAAGGTEAESKAYTLTVVKNYQTYDRTGWTATAGSVEEQNASATEGPANLALDGNKNSIWHTAWNGCDQEDVWIVIDMKEQKQVDRLRYLPRQTGNLNGTILGYEVYGSNSEAAVNTLLERQDGGNIGLDESWTKLASGTWESSKDEKSAELQSGTYRYIRLVGTSTQKDNTGANAIFGSAAEIYLDYVETAGQDTQE